MKYLVCLTIIPTYLLLLSPTPVKATLKTDPSKMEEPDTVKAPSSSRFLKTNPDISVNILLLGKKSFQKTHEEEHTDDSDHHEDDENDSNHENHTGHHKHSFKDGVFIQELEVYFKSNIDPYWTGDVSLGLTPTSSGIELNLEEAFIESLFIPNVTLKAGKFYALIGRHNSLHTHNFPFIDPPLVNEVLFGAHGFGGTGASLSYLAPFFPWYFEVSSQIFHKSPLHESQNRVAGLVFLKNVWDLNDHSTLEFDLAYGHKITHKHLFNLSSTYKYQPLNSSKKNSLNWTTEFFKVKSPLNLGNNVFDSLADFMGLSSYVQWQFLENWWLQGQISAITPTSLNKVEAHKHSLLLAFAATEYSAIRLQYDASQFENENWEHSVALQLNMSLGTHPAHLY